MTPDALFWIVLIGGGSAFELWAIFNRRRGDTLSENTRRVPRWAFAAFMAWLIVHILGGEQPGWTWLISLLAAAAAAFAGDRLGRWYERRRARRE